jgi:SAM-dependent methyltransferase
VTEQHFVALDLGCAAGRMTCELAWSGAARVIGVDKSSRMLNWARKIAWARRSQSISVPVPLTASRTTHCYISGMEMRNRTAFVIGDAQTIPLPACSVHLICCMNVLHRLPRPDRVLKEIQRVLKPDGYLVISNDYDWNDDFTPLRRLWFDDFRTVLPRDVWETLDEIDPVPYEAPVHGRKVTRALNHLMLIRKRR